MQRAIKILCTICWLSFSIKGLAQEKTDLGRITEVIAYPLRDLSFISPRFDRTNYKNGSFFDNYTLRTVITTKGKNHFRLDIPISKTNATPNGAVVTGINDISFRYTRLLWQKNSSFGGVFSKMVLPTSNNVSIGLGRWQWHNGIGMLHLLPNKKGSIYLGAEYKMGIDGNKYEGKYSAFGFSPNIDYWGKKWYIGYYPTWGYDFIFKKWDIPLDIEYGHFVLPEFLISLEYIVPLTADAVYKETYALKFRYSFKLLPKK